MRFCVVFIIVTLVGSSKIQYDDGYDDSSGSSESQDYIPHVETTLDFRGLVRKLFILELGLNLDNKNVICSPISALLPLAKLIFGAKKKSKTETELLNAVGLRSRTEVKFEFRRIIKELEYLKGVEMNLATRLYVSRKYSLMPKFVRKAQSVFQSTIEVIDISKPKDAAKRINEWMRENTDNKIKEIIEASDITPMVSLIVVNAIYFKGAWMYPFPPARKELFYSPAGVTRVDMMTKSESYNYVRCDELNAQIVEIPYKGGETSMIVVLPYAKNGLPILLQTLKTSQSIFNTALMKMKTAFVEVSIPKFKIETAVNLLKYYKKMGIKYTLDSQMSDLKNIVRGEKLYISGAIHKAIIEVNEKGTVAAASSGAMMVPHSLVIHDIIFKADHPFLIFIKAFNEQLFAGIVNSP